MSDSHGCRVGLTDFDGGFGETLAAVGTELAARGVEVVEAPERSAGRGYYPGLCFKMAVDAGGEWIEIGDGGAVDWAARLMGSAKERLMTSGLSLERLAGLQ